MRRGAVDIGTNSVRLLIVDDGGSEITRRQVVTGLGRGASSDGDLATESIARTLAVLGEFAVVLAEENVNRRRAVATAATRDAPNRQAFVDQAEAVLAAPIEVISGQLEAELAFAGATAGLTAGPYLVVDIGGGSTEFVTEASAVSIDIGSVRLSERALGDRPVAFDQLEMAARMVEELFTAVTVPAAPFTALGVAGTWTSLAAIVKESSESVHGQVLRRFDLDHLVGRLAALTVEETAALPGLDPARAPVILGGAVVARESLRRLAATEITVSELDLLDGVVAGLA